MYPTMIVVTFGLGVGMALAGVMAYFLGRGGKGGLTLKAGKLELSTTNTALALIGLGIFVILVAFSSTRAVAEKQDLLADREAQVKGATKVSAAYAKVELPAGAAISPEQLARQEGLQDLAFASFRDLARDEELALFLLRELTTNTFGLVSVPKASGHRFDGLLTQIAQQYGDDVRVQIELAKGYRSLYEVTPEATYLEKFYGYAQSAVAGGAGSGEERFAAHQLLALALQRQGKHEESLRYLEEAEQLVPAAERYKLAFNFCNVLHTLKREDEALARCQESAQLAAAQGLHFWQPSFLAGLIQLRQGNPSLAVAAFLESKKLAGEVHEVDLANRYLEGQASARVLCTDSDFAKSFAAFCAPAVETPPANSID